MLEKIRKTVAKWVRFNFIGTIGVGVQLVILSLCTHFLHFNYFVANLVAVQSSVIHNFFWHQRWTWAEVGSRSKTQSFNRFLRFNSTIGVMSIAGNVGFTWLLVRSIQMPYLICNLLAIGACNVLNFLLARNFVFRLSPESVSC